MTKMEDHGTIGVLTRGMIGMLATVGTVGVSQFSTLETGLRISGLIVGMLVGITTLYSLWRGPRKPRD